MTKNKLPTEHKSINPGRRQWLAIPKSIRRQLSRLHILRHLPLVQVPSPNENIAPKHYEVREDAYHRIHGESEGSLVLISNHYLGDQFRHPFYHTDCGKAFMMSHNELTLAPAKVLCPHCNENGPDNLNRFVTMNDAQEYVLEKSLNNIFLLRRNKLGPITSNFHFYCLLDRAAFDDTFVNFQKGVNKETFGCPICRRNI